MGSKSDLNIFNKRIKNKIKTRMRETCAKEKRINENQDCTFFFLSSEPVPPFGFEPQRSPFPISTILPTEELDLK
ncbi:hypothetical protein PRUPE_2G064300 [Prunus persica]|uniref:Uncharacterized protein n=1 Tax=Prunus persica TaxID=3760 RepID=A0A251QC68_PRUPE|nr:hypothetical protein PRUPE_2G064300 [Prunus persica]